MNPSRTPALNEPPLSRRAVALTLLSYIGAVLLNLHHAAVWCAPVALLAAGWCWRVTLGRQRLPTRALRLATVVVLTLAVLGSFRTLNGVAAGATLLVVMGALKLLETRRVRDWLVMIAVAVFLLLAACLDHQSLWLLPLYAAEVWLSCAALYAIGAGGVSLPVAALARASGRGLLLALPLAVLLFVFFPRLPGSFWGVPRSDEAVTGLGEEMSPGSISQLSESDDVALRVRFDGPLPPPQQRYWRGPVMHDFDGYTWRRRRDEFAFQPQVHFTGPVYRYQITLEPSPQNVLIALELPVGPPSTPPNAFFTFDYQLLAPRPNTLAVTYALESAPAHDNAGALSALGRRLDLELPPGRNPRARALAEQLRARAASDAAFVDAVLDYFRHGGFSYTLTPARLNLNSVDDFLFNTREGFCGHYASAFVSLMRAGGVPARVITGYQGGEWNRFGDYLLVRQSHAHAWAEVWLDGRGWVRVDPVAAVAPERLTRDVFDLLPQGVDAAGRLRNLPWLGPVLQAWEAMDAWWQDDVIGFNVIKQMNLVERIGFSPDDWRAFAVLLAAGSTFWALWLGWSLRPQRRAARDPLARAWQRLERRLRGLAPARAVYEGPVAYAERVALAAPALAGPLLLLARRFAQLRYGPPPSLREVTRFSRAVRGFVRRRG